MIKMCAKLANLNEWAEPFLHLSRAAANLCCYYSIDRITIPKYYFLMSIFSTPTDVLRKAQKLYIKVGIM